ncbi:MAG: peroxiredoxin [Actinomycetota bacterium]|nr:peroxiredoxin [Actinomycetota bacterium]
MIVSVGQPAPDFELPDQHGRPVRLSSFRGRSAVVLVFYPFAFTPTCTGEICAIRDEGAGLSRPDAQVLAVSCDPVPSLRVFAEQHGVEYPLLSDFWPHGEVSRTYGAFLEERGMATRATFVIDREGTVRWSVLNSPGEARNTQDYLKVLADL